MLIPITIQVILYFYKKNVIIRCDYIDPMTEEKVVINDPYICIMCNVNPKCTGDSCVSSPYVNRASNFIYVYFGLNIIMFIFLVEMLLRMIYQTGVARFIALYKVKAVSQKGTLDLIKANKVALSLMTLFVVFCGIVLYIAQKYTEENSSGLNNCTVGDEKITKMNFYSFDSN